MELYKILPMFLLQDEGGAPMSDLPPEGAQGGGGQFLIVMLGMILIFYFLLIRPQQQRQKEHESMLKAIERGDQVITSGGLHGKVTGVADDVLTLEIAALKSGDRVRVKVARSRVESIAKAQGDDQGGDK